MKTIVSLTSKLLLSFLQKWQSQWQLALGALVMVGDRAKWHFSGKYTFETLLRSAQNGNNNAYNINPPLSY
jgi:hypothetical protein